MTGLAQTLSLRPFRLDDAGTIEPWLSAPGLSLPGGAARREWPARLLADQRIVLRVAEAGGRQVGIVRLDCGPDRIAEITVVVAPEQRRCGNGRAMLQRAVELSRHLGLRQLVASVDLGNATALEFFQDLGFVHSGIVGNRLRLERPVHAADGQPPLEIDV